MTFRDNHLSLVEGRHITPEDINVVIISEILAAENNVNIGDVLEVRPAEIGVNEEGLAENALGDNAPSTSVTVIGIYADNVLRLEHTQPAAGIIANQIFADHSTMTSLGVAYQGQYEAVTFHVNDPSKLPQIVAEIWQTGELDRDYFFMQHNDGNYMRISSDLLNKAVYFLV